ncbi:hypothetical protein HPB47_011892 [Ixodes persulcatus]|uniref:Uncharacterized protein n=1 Tax=Ixodes persulcatus TaxID=34615 RepID=A0AC60NV52_IXOPE|nr:hypothetical protein HPB47_011892 [Ixodes persulcatus]
MTVKCIGFGPKENKDKFFIYTVVSGVKGSGHAEAEQPCYPARSHVLRGGTFLEFRRHTLWLRTPSESLMFGREE